MDQSELVSATSWLHWLSAIKYIGGALVVVGVAAELLGDWFSEPLQKKLDDARKVEIAQLTNEASRLSAQAETARASIADANARAESERLKRIELEAKIAPRRLSGEQRDRFVAAISKVPIPPTIAVVSRLFDAEGIDFADDLSAVLTAAGWHTDRLRNWTMAQKGLFVATAEGSTVGREDPTIVGLSSALDAAGIAHTALTIGAKDNATVTPFFRPNVLYLLVGAKP